jgi:hypothetical protein
VAFSTVVDPLSVVIVAIAPSVDALAVLFASQVLAFVLVSIFIFHTALALVFAVNEAATIGGVVLLKIFSFAMKSAVGPLPLVPIPVFVLDLAVATLHSFLPVSGVCELLCFLHSVSFTVALLEWSPVFRFLEVRIFSPFWIFLSL